MSTCAHLAALIEQMEPLVLRFLPGFDQTNATRQAQGLPNHLAWTLGHLALYNHRAAERISGVENALAWDTEPFAFQSTPAEGGAVYPPLEEVTRRFRESVAMLAAAVRAAGDAGLTKAVPWGSGTITARDLAGRMIFHNGQHTGQIVDLRRALRLPRIVG